MRKNITLIEPSKEYEKQLLSYKQEFSHEGIPIDGDGGLEEAQDISEYLKLIEIYKSKDTVPKDRSTANTYMAITDDNELVGIVNIRHELTDYLLNFGGHIGYGVRKSERQKGYATEILRLALLKCKDLKIEKALVVCDFDNIASEKTILNNNGILENQIPFEDISIKRFWIDVK